jgi:hypothetical protein
MSTPTADRTPKRTTAHPAKDSGGGMIDLGKIPPRIFVMPKPEYSVLAVYVYRGGVKIGERLTLNIPPDDYARHWELEGPHA